MNRQSGRELLRRQVGAVIQHVYIELWADSPEALRHLISVGIEFQEGPGFILCCAGRGGIAARKGRLETVAEHLQLQQLRQLSGSVVESVKVSDNELAISTGDHQIQMVNDDDELSMTVNGRDVMELVDRSA